ncbi:MAG: glutamyl-tRNA reductase [Gammaproteobacteria bacterium]|nr:glutamyl-tRNA reductase [Gammaproteobacteria bacterium]
MAGFRTELSFCPMLFVIGVSHKTAPLAVRERLAVAPERVAEVLDSLLEKEGVEEAVLLTTCNRNEIYAWARPQDKRLLIDWLSRLGGAPEPGWNDYYYAHEGEAAARHLFRVAAGLESMAPGETQIQGQVKTAYQDAHHAAAAVGPELHQLFQHALNAAKGIRTETSLDAPHSIPYAAIRLARKEFGSLGGKTALLVGAGNTVRALAFHLRQQGIGRLRIANRSAEAARELANEFDGTALGLDDIPAAIVEADILASATNSESTLLNAGSFALRQIDKPLLVLDLAVPRDVDHRVGALPGIRLISVDDLAEVIAGSREMHDSALSQASRAIEPALAAWRKERRIRTAVPTICALRAEATQARRETLTAARQIAATRGIETALEYLASTLTNRLIHAPTVRLREAAVQKDEALIAAARDLFDLGEKDKQGQHSDDAAA